jgi:hypothetical protein
MMGLFFCDRCQTVQPLRATECVALGALIGAAVFCVLLMASVYVDGHAAQGGACTCPDAAAAGGVR